MRVEVVVNYLPPRPYAWVRFIGLILTFIFMIEMDRAAYKMIAYALAMKMRSSTWLMFPLFWPQLTILVGFVLLTLMLAVDIARAGIKLRAGKSAEA